MTCILATSKTWQPSLIENLQKRTSKSFVTIHSPTELTPDFVSQIKPEYILFPHWSFIIPADIYNNHECIIFHMTDLPYGRGGSPLQNLIINGINQTQISALRCEKNLDSGPIYLKKPLSLQGRAQDIYYQANLIIEDMIVEIIKNKLTPTPQQGESVSFERRTKEQSSLIKVDSTKTAYDMIRMLDADGYPHAYLETDFLRFEFTRAALTGNEIIADVRIKLKEK